MKNKLLIYAAVGLALVLSFVGATYMYQSSQKAKLDFLATEKSELFVRDYSPRYGNTEAKVILTEFLDPECESCRAFYPVVKSFLNEFEGQVQLVVRYAPFHQNSKIAIKALEAARMQGKYWEALELLFYHQPKWGSHHNPKPELIFEYLPQLGLDMDKLKEDMESQKIKDIIEQDQKDLRALSVRATPTFFVNGRPLEEFSVDALHALIKDEVSNFY